MRQFGAAGASPAANGGSGGRTSVTDAGDNASTADAGERESADDGRGTGTAGSGGSPAAAIPGGSGGGAAASGPPANPTDCPADAFACRGDTPTAASALGTNKGPYPVGMITDGYRDGSDFADATIYYPMGDAKPPFGCVSVCPNFVGAQNTISAWGPFLASHGIVVIAIGTNSTSDLPPARANALMDSLTTCAAENDRTGSPLLGKVSKDRLGVYGLGMGGGGALIAASTNSTLRAAVTYGAWEATGVATDIVPSLLFNGTADSTAASMPDDYYSQIPNGVDKLLFEVSDADQYVGEDPANAQGFLGLYALSWWKVYLEGDKRYKQLLQMPKPSVAEKITTTLQ